MSLVGDWRNADPRAGFVRLVVTDREGLGLQAWTADGPLPPAPAVRYHDDAVEAVANGILAEIELGFQTILVAGYVKRGVFCLSTFTRFEEGDPRAPYYTREFFGREAP